MPEAVPPQAVPPQAVPTEIRALAERRSAARRAKDWPEADRLRAEIQTAGWRVVDSGLAFLLSPLHPPTTVTTGRSRYGQSGAVPSRLDEPAIGLATVVLLATDWPADLERALAGLRAHAPAGVGVVIVADGPSTEQEAALEGLEAQAKGGPGSLEIVWTSERLGHATALNCGIRRAGSPIVTVLDTSVEPAGDFVTPLVLALDDPAVAVAGGWGIVSDDLRHFRDAPHGDVDAIEGYCLAFRRADYAMRGPLHEKFRFYRNLDVWWSLVLRDEGAGLPPRRARSVLLPLIRHENRVWESLPETERARLSRRNFYRILERFGSRRDLLVSR